jgi:hypothetical protein
MPEKKMRVILEDYGPVMLEMEEGPDTSTAGAFYNVMTRYLEGGTTQHDASHYAQRVESFDGTTVSGVIHGGPYDGTTVQHYPIETDLSTLAVYAHQGEMDGDSPYEHWGQ